MRTDDGLRVGSIVYATEQGLGYLAKSFFDAGIVTDVAVVAHGRHQTHWGWYGGHCPRIMNLRRSLDHEEMKRLCQRVDAMLFFETPFYWPLIDYCREIGVTTFLMTMYECTPRILPAVPDRFLCPSVLDMDYFPPEKSTFLPVPVAGIPWKKRTKAETFVHNAGHGGLRGRNGTKELIDAWDFVQSPARLIIRSQDRIGEETVKMSRTLQQNVAGGVMDVIIGSVPRDELYKWGDVFIFPEKFNGLSLPLQEAKASGMLVVATDRRPNNTWLTVEPSIPVIGYRDACIGPPYNTFKEAMIDPRDIAQVIDQVYGMDLSGISEAGKSWANSMSWEVLGPMYREEIRRLTKRKEDRR